MSLQEKSPWTKFGFEGVLIIVSILVAFSIEEWRQNRTNAEQEHALLRALNEDFIQAAAGLVSVKDAHTSVAGYGEQIILQADRGPVPEAEREQFEKPVGGHFRRTLFRPPMGTVETILGSGRIDLISNQALITELTQWSSVIARLNLVEAEARDHFYTRIYPYLASKLNLKDLDKGYARFFPQFPFEQRPVDAYLLIEDEEFVGMIYMHWVLRTNALDALQPVEESLEKIRALIRDEIGELD